MPLFTSKFSQRKTVPRKSPSLSNLHRDIGPQQTQSEFGIDYGPVRLKLGDLENTFENGQWQSVHDGKKPSSKEVSKLKKQNQELREENNLLKLKIEILLDMLAETTAEMHIQEKEIENLKSTTSKRNLHKRR